MRHSVPIRVFSVLLCLAALFLSTAVAGAGERGSVLHIYTWEDYFSPDAVHAFEEKYNCRVEFTFYDSNETMMESVHGGDGYDLITPMPIAVLRFMEADFLQPLDHSLIPNLKYIDPATPALDHDPEMAYSVPYTVTITGVGYRRSTVPEEALGDWDIFSSPRFGKKMAMLNDSRETLGAALKELGYSLNSTDSGEVGEAGRLLVKWKSNIAAFDVDRAKASLLSGEFVAIQGYNGDIAQIMSEDPEVDFYVPVTGSSFNADTFVIPNDAASPDLAHAFINHFLDPAVAAMNIEHTYYLMPNPEALKLLPETLRDSPCYAVSPEILKKCEMIHDIGNAREIYDQVWESVLMGKN